MTNECDSSGHSLQKFLPQSSVTTDFREALGVRELAPAFWLTERPSTPKRRQAGALQTLRVEGWPLQMCSRDVFG
jgi:hypothetical protein